MHNQLQIADIPNVLKIQHELEAGIVSQFDYLYMVTECLYSKLEKELESAITKSHEKYPVSRGDRSYLRSVYMAGYRYWLGMDFLEKEVDSTDERSKKFILETLDGKYIQFKVSEDGNLIALGNGYITPDPLRYEFSVEVPSSGQNLVARARNMMGIAQFVEELYFGRGPKGEMIWA